jgi:hypothetical protein
MSLYLCIYEYECEIHGIDVGSYSDFNAFRTKLFHFCESNKIVNPLYTLMNHSDCEGEWTPLECKKLVSELHFIKELVDKSLTEDLKETKMLIEAILYLSHLSVRYNSPILFQ